jgi:predicted DNA-binding transcriptional regulator AlpA
MNSLDIARTIGAAASELRLAATPDVVVAPQPGAPGPLLACDWMVGAAQASQMLNLGKTALYDGVKAGTLPAPYRLYGRRVAWKASEIQAYLNSLHRVDPAGEAIDGSKS